MSKGTKIDVTNELLDKYCRVKQLTTDYQLAKSLGCSHSTISNYRNHKTKMDPTACVQIAEALRIDPMLVIAKLRLDAANTDREVNVWTKYAGRTFFLAAAISTLVMSSLDIPNADLRKNAIWSQDNIYIMRT